MLARRTGLAFSLALTLALCTLAAPTARAGETSATPEQLLKLLAAGLDEDLVAEEGQCGDVAALREFLYGPAGEFAVVRAGFDPDTAAVHHTTRTALAAEREGLVATTFHAFSLFATSGASQSAGVGNGGFRLRTLRPTSAGDPLFDGFWDPLGDPFRSFGPAPAGSRGGAVAPARGPQRSMGFKKR